MSLSVLAARRIRAAVARGGCFFCDPLLSTQYPPTTLTGEATPSLRSQPQPQGRAATEDGVTVLVGSSYEQAVLGAESHHTVVMVRVGVRVRVS